MKIKIWPSLRVLCVRARSPSRFCASGGARVRIGGGPDRPPPEPPSSPSGLGWRDTAPTKAAALYSFVRLFSLILKNTAAGA